MPLQCWIQGEDPGGPDAPFRPELFQGENILNVLKPKFLPPKNCVWLVNTG